MPRPGGRLDEAVAAGSTAREETWVDSPGGPADTSSSAPSGDAQGDPRATAGELAALADALLEQARALRSQYEELLELLAEAGDPRAGGEPAPGRPMARMPSGASPTAARAHARSAAPRRSGRGGGLADREAAGEGRGDEGAMLIALQMALNGSSREETAAYLRETFGIEGDDVLEEAYGRTPAPPAAPTRR